MMKTLIWSLLIVCIASAAAADVEGGKAALRRGDYAAAYRAFLPDAEAGDDIAMVTIGLLYHQGRLGAIDYSKAMDWYIRAFDRENGDAFSNIGVMYRDGLGVRKNLEIAYSLFLIVHMSGMGSEATQVRTNDNLRRLVAELSPAQLARALCSTDDYIDAYVRLRGKVAADFQGSPNAVRLRDKDWWLPSEQPKLPSCK